MRDGILTLMNTFLRNFWKLGFVCYMFLQVSLLAFKNLLCGEGALRARKITIAPWSRRAENISMT